MSALVSLLLVLVLPALAGAVLLSDAPRAAAGETGGRARRPGVTWCWPAASPSASPPGCSAPGLLVRTVGLTATSAWVYDARGGRGVPRGAAAPPPARPPGRDAATRVPGGSGAIGGLTALVYLPLGYVVVRTTWSPHRVHAVVLLRPRPAGRATWLDPGDLRGVRDLHAVPERLPPVHDRDGDAARAAPRRPDHGAHPRHPGRRPAARRRSRGAHLGARRRTARRPDGGPRRRRHRHRGRPARRPTAPRRSPSAWSLLVVALGRRLAPAARRSFPRHGRPARRDPVAGARHRSPHGRGDGDRGRPRPAHARLAAAGSCGGPAIALVVFLARSRSPVWRSARRPAPPTRAASSTGAAWPTRPGSSTGRPGARAPSLPPCNGTMLRDTLPVLYSGSWWWVVPALVAGRGRPVAPPAGPGGAAGRRLHRSVPRRSGARRVGVHARVGRLRAAPDRRLADPPGGQPPASRRSSRSGSAAWHARRSGGAAATPGRVVVAPGRALGHGALVSTVGVARYYDGGSLEPARARGVAEPADDERRRRPGQRLHRGVHPRRPRPRRVSSTGGRRTPSTGSCTAPTGCSAAGRRSSPTRPCTGTTSRATASPGWWWPTRAPTPSARATPGTCLVDPEALARCRGLQRVVDDPSLTVYRVVDPSPSGCR